MSSAATDTQRLVEAAARGDRAAYRSLVATHQNLVSSIALAVVRDASASEDVAQEVFLHAWRGLGKLRNPRSFLPWLRQVTRNRAHQLLRERKGVVPTEANLLEQVVDPKADPSGALVDAEDRARLAAAVEALPEDSREAVMLFYREGQSVAQVASLLDLREEAVRQRLSRARALLRDALLDTLGEQLVATAPREKFCAGVMAALPSAGPATGVAAALRWTLLGKSAAAFVGPGVGMASAIAGLLWGHRRSMKRAKDDEERDGLVKLKNATLVLMVATCTLTVPLLKWRAAMLGLWALYIVGIAVLHTVWYPRIVARRRAAEIRENPKAIWRWRLRIWGGRLYLVVLGTALLTFLWERLS